jgi:hypothetical protein
VRLRLDIFRRTAVDHAENAAALLGFGDDYLNRIGSGAINARDFRDGLNASEDVDGKTIPQRDDEDMASGNIGGILDGILLESFVVAVKACQAVAGSLVKCDSELNMRRCVHDCFIDILDSLDEVTLAEDDISVLGNRKTDGLKLHAVTIAGSL